MLSLDEKNSYLKNGYLILNNKIEKNILEDLKSATKEMIIEFKKNQESFIKDKKRNISQHGKMFLSNRCEDFEVMEQFAKGSFIKSICRSVLGDKVKDVKSSNRLSDSPSCIVADENDPTAQMQEIMRATGQVGMPEIKPILEINPGHKIIKKLVAMRKGKAFDDGVLMIYEQALLQEGVKLEDPAGFVKRLNRLMEKSL